MPKDFVISVMSLDRVGIVAGLTEAVAEHGGNIDAISQTVLRGYFTIILTARFEADQHAGALADAVMVKASPGALRVSIMEREVAEPQPVVAEAELFVLTISGADRTGIIHRVASYLASRSINIADLYAYTRGDEFQLLAQVEVPAGMEVERLKMDVEGLWPAAEMRVSLQHAGIFMATNDVNFRQETP